jgi:hypothetical protein
MMLGGAKIILALVGLFLLTYACLLTVPALGIGLAVTMFAAFWYGAYLFITGRLLVHQLRTGPRRNVETVWSARQLRNVLTAEAPIALPGTSIDEIVSQNSCQMALAL